LSQRASLLSAPIRWPKNCSGVCNEPTASRSAAASARIMRPPEAPNIMQAVTRRSRMDAVQAPIIPVIGEMIREAPGTSSLGQGMVHYGPPRPSIEAAIDALDDMVTHEYGDGAGAPALVERLEDKLRRENGIDVGRGSRVMVTAGANMAFMHLVFAITEP